MRSISFTTTIECGTVMHSVMSVCLFVLFMLQIMKAWTYKLHLWYASTSSEHLHARQVCISSSWG